MKTKVTMIDVESGTVISQHYVDVIDDDLYCMWWVCNEHLHHSSVSVLISKKGIRFEFKKV